MDHCTSVDFRSPNIGLCEVAPVRLARQSLGLFARLN
jgi:hypothetical protein